MSRKEMGNVSEPDEVNGANRRHEMLDLVREQGR